MINMVLLMQTPPRKKRDETNKPPVKEQKTKGDAMDSVSSIGWKSFLNNVPAEHRTIIENWLNKILKQGKRS